MARRTVESSVTGETFIFDDEWNESDGRVRQLEYFLAPNKSVPLHSHPRTAQGFEVKSGRLHIRVNGQTRILNEGENASTAIGEVHSQWNEGPDVARVIESYSPPIAIEPFFTNLPRAIASRNPFKIAVFLSDFGAIDAPATLAQRLFIGMLAPLGRLFGLTRWYERVSH